MPEFISITNTLWVKMESAELDLNVLNAKIQGTWPKDEDEIDKYFHYICGKKYEITTKTIKE